MTKTYRGALLLALVISLLLPATAAAAVPSSVIKGLDWLHTRQRSDGGFSYTSSSGNSSDTPWIMLAIAAGNNGPGRWQVSGHSPVTFLQHTALDTAAKNTTNAPEFYALCILAYRAAGRTDLLATAGSTQVDLISKLESYQSLTDGYYSPNPTATAVIDATAQATETTTFAVLALVAAHESGQPLSAAVTWLRGQANASAGPDQGGFGSSPTSDSSTTITSLAIQALVAAEGTAAGRADTVVKGAVDFIKSMQRTSGGFWDNTPNGFANAPSTAWAIEGLNAAGIKTSTLPHSPYTFLASLRHTNGSTYEFTGGDIGDVLNATTQATIALSGKWLPITLSHNVATRFDPSFAADSVVPKKGARFAGRTVEVRASYHDNTNGTGISTSTITVSVDGRSKTKAAHISASHLSLQLTKLANGSHTFIIRIHDRAGNDAQTQHSFTVAVPAGGGSTGGGTHPGGGSSSGSSTSTGSGTTTHPTTTPKATIAPSTGVSPGVTLTPTPASSFPASALSPSPSTPVSGQVAGGGGGSGGGGHTAAIVGGALAALVPLGFAASWIVRRNLMGVMAGASRGEILQGGTSVWQRFWKSAGGSPPAHGGE